MVEGMADDPKRSVRQLLEAGRLTIPRVPRFTSIDEPDDPGTFGDAMAYAMEAIRSGPREPLPDFPADLAPGEARNAHGGQTIELHLPGGKTRRLPRRTGARWIEGACSRVVSRRGLAGLGFGLAASHGAPASLWSSGS
jgi:hypothetical protein